MIAEERPRIHLTTSFTKLFANLGLSTRAVSTSFGCRVNVGISFPVSITWVKVFRINPEFRILEDDSP